MPPPYLEVEHFFVLLFSESKPCAVPCARVPSTMHGFLFLDVSQSFVTSFLVTCLFFIRLLFQNSAAFLNSKVLFQRKFSHFSILLYWLWQYFFVAKRFSPIEYYFLACNSHLIFLAFL